MAERSAKRIFCALLTAACLAGGFAPAGVEAAETFGWTNIPETGEEDAVADTESAASAAKEKSSDSGIAREKRYLLGALDQLQEMGLSPILIWSEITKDPKLMDTVNSAKDSAWETVTQKVSEAGETATKAVSDAVRTEAEKGKKSLIRMIREQIQSFLDGLWPEGTL